MFPYICHILRLVIVCYKTVRLSQNADTAFFLRPILIAYEALFTRLDFVSRNHLCYVLGLINMTANIYYNVRFPLMTVE